MSRNLLLFDTPGLPDLAQFTTQVNARLATLLTSLIGSVQITTTQKIPAYVREVKLAIDTDSGGTTITHPYQMIGFQGTDDADVLSQMNAFRGANPSYFYGPVIYAYSDQLSGVPFRSMLFLLYNQNQADGTANWQPGFYNGGGGGSPSTVDWLNVKRFGALGDGASHPLSSLQAAIYNTLYGAVGLNVSAGDENDYAAIQAALYTAANSGFPVYIPTGVYYTNKPLQLAWTATPISGQPQTPAVTQIIGDGYSSQIFGLISTSGRAVLELLGESNIHAVNMEVSGIRLFHRVGSDLGAYCLRAGDAKESLRVKRVWCEGINGVALKIASSSSYAQIDTIFEQVSIQTNYSGLYAAESAAGFFALFPETGGASWDNVKFDSCLFGGLVVTRGTLPTFFNCQFFSDSVRPINGGYDCANCLTSPLGSVYVDTCYFEDHKIAILITNGISNLISATIKASHFSGVNNNGTKPDRAVQVVDFGTNKMGAVTVEGCRFNFQAPGPTVGYNVCIDAHDVEIQALSNVNIYDSTVSVTTNFTNSRQVFYDPATGTFTSTQGVFLAATTTAISLPNGGITAHKTIHSDVSVESFNLQVLATPSTPGIFWGLDIQIANTFDSWVHGWTSITYTTGGTFPWLGNDMAMEYIPVGHVKRMGFGASASLYYEWSSTLQTMPGGLLINTAQDPTLVANVPCVLKFTRSAASLAAAATSAGFTLFTLPAACKIVSVTIRPTQSFTGGGLSGYTVEVGSVASSTKYAPAFNVFQAITGTVFEDSNLPGMEDFSSSQPIQIVVRSAGANLNAATQGSVDIYVVLEKLA